MALFTETTTFGPYNNVDKTALLGVDAGTGSVTLELNIDGDDWVTQEAFTADAVKRIFIGGGRWRCTVVGNARFVWVD